jgi:hypothetical protein
MAAASTTPYIKLPGRGLRHPMFAFANAARAVSATRCRLWLGPDHLLSVDSTIASESYRRFYFRDIEAFIVRRTVRRQVWNWVLLVLILISAGPFAIAWRSDGEGGFLVAAICIASFWLVFMLINTLRGATCQTHIRTAVQLERLPSLSRLPVARKVLARLQPLIIATQGAATPEELATAPWMSANAPADPRMAAVGVAPARADKGHIHAALFGLLIAEAILTVIASVFFHEPISVFSLLAMLGGCIACVVALVRQRNTDLPDAVRTMTKVTLGYYVLKCLAGFIYMIVFAANHPGTPMITGLEMVGEPGFSETALGGAGVGAIIGLIGLVVLLSRARQPAAPIAT